MNFKIGFIFVLLMMLSCKGEIEINAFTEINSLEHYQDYVADGVKLVLFHSPTCGLCDKQREEIRILFAEEQLLSVGFAQVNYLTLPEIFNLEGLNGFPNILIFKNGELQHQLQGSNNSYDALREKLLLLLQ